MGGLLDGCREHGWRVIHDASLGRGNVDHIVIGPAGVFTIETKSHPGPVRVARVHGATLNQAQAQRRAIERVTGVEVEPLIVFSRAWVDRPMARRKGVRVLPARMLVGYLTRLPATHLRAGDRARAGAGRAGADRAAGPPAHDRRALAGAHRAPPARAGTRRTLKSRLAIGWPGRSPGASVWAWQALLQRCPRAGVTVPSAGRPARIRGCRRARACRRWRRRWRGRSRRRG